MPLGESLLAKAIGDLAMGGLRAVSRIDPDGVAERPNSWSVAITNTAGEIIGILSSTQAEDVAKFLSSFEVRNLFQAHFLCRMAIADKYGASSILDELRASFELLAEHWCLESTDSWESYASDLWRNLETYFESALPAQSVLETLTTEELQDFHNQMGGDPTATKTRKGIPKFLRELVDMSLDLDRLLSARDNVSDIRSHLSEYYAQIRLDHSPHDFRIRIDELYIDRDLTEPTMRKTISSSEIFSNKHKVKMVVTGDPGVGKSTFTEYLIRQLSDVGGDEWTTPLIVHCREYASAGLSNIVDLIREKLSATFHLRLSEQEMEDILTLGRAFLIIDGVDEIIDVGRRRKLVRSVEAFARRYPICSVIATSRNIGYTQAQFDPQLFVRYELLPFTHDQVSAYAKRWFSLAGRSESDLAKFMTELDSIPDLRGNPLMLSLLCILYKARGHIPRNRRQVYSQCADLLFNRWDSMRHIEQPYDHQHYGDELMQEIASWFYKSQSAQAGIEEQQIRKVIAGFLVDTAAVPESAAHKRAETFLDFCADRAWLLGTAGTNDRDQRIFVFTHRTFMEFFAAESLVRNSEINYITEEVAKIYDKDASSVLPDLIVQSAEVHRRGGARQIIGGLLDRGRSLGKKNYTRYLPLCLRIINLSPVSPSLMDDVFRRTIADWSATTPSASYASVIAALDLYRDPRSRLMDHLKANTECMRGRRCHEPHAHPLEDFVTLWARIYLKEQAHEYIPEWNEFVNESVLSILDHLLESKDAALRHYLVEAGYTKPPKVELGHLVANAFESAVAGFALRSVERTLWGRDSEQDRHIVHELGIHVESVALISSVDAYKLDNIVRERARLFPSDWLSHAHASSHSSILKNILIWIGCCVYESYGHPSLFHDTVEEFIGFDFKSIFNTREHYHDKKSREFRRMREEEERRDAGLKPLAPTAIKGLARHHAAWLPRWCRGSVDLVLAPRDAD
jgi:hypothetical protein